jgi:hypothetical protein
MPEPKSFDEMVGEKVVQCQVAAAAGRKPEYQEAAFETAVQKGQMSRKVAKHFLATDIDAQLDKREQAYSAAKARIAQDPSKLAVLDPSEAKRIARQTELAAAKAEKAALDTANQRIAALTAELTKVQALVAAGPCPTTSPEVPIQGKGKDKGKGKDGKAAIS